VALPGRCGVTHIASEAALTALIVILL